MKQKINEFEGIPIDKQRLVFSGKEFQDDNLLSQYGIKNGSSVLLVLRLSGDIGHFEESDIEDQVNKYLECEKERSTASEVDIKNIILNLNGKQDAKFQILPSIGSLKCSALREYADKQYLIAQ